MIEIMCKTGFMSFEMHQYSDARHLLETEDDAPSETQKFVATVNFTFCWLLFFFSHENMSFYSLLQLTLAIPAFVIITIAYSLIRQRSSTMFLLEPRKYACTHRGTDSSDVTRPEIQFQSFRNRLHGGTPTFRTFIEPPFLGDGFFEWIVRVWQLSPQELQKYSGFDALVFLGFIKTCIKICLYSLPFALFVVIPTYATEVCYTFYYFLFNSLCVSIDA